MAMKGEEQSYRVIRDIFCSIIRNVADLYPIFSTGWSVDNIEADAHPRNHAAVPKLCGDRFADWHLVRHNRGGISDLLYNVALHSQGRQLEPGALKQLSLDRKVGIGWIEIIDSVTVHNSADSELNLR